MTVRVSVVVPVRDEQATIGALLDSLLMQSQPAAEIIVVDAGSVDRTAEIVRKYSAAAVRVNAPIQERPAVQERDSAVIPVRLLTLGPAFPGVARNAGVEAASSPYIAFTDAGIQLDRHWLERLCVALDPGPAANGPRSDVVFGSYQPVTSTFFGQCAATAYVPARSREHGKEIRGPFIASCLMRKTVFNAAGGFPAGRAAEDLIFLERIQQREWRIAYAPDAIAYWEMARGWRSTYRRFALYSYHNLVAGRGRYWHQGVARWYVLAAPFVILGCLDRTAWLTIPVLGGCARIAVTIWRKRKEQWGAAFNPLRWIVVGLVMLLLDAATFAGAVRWAWDRVRGRLPQPVPACGDAGVGETSHEETPA